MPAKTQFVSYRISAEVAAELEASAKALGLSRNGFACEALLEKLHRAKAERAAWSDVFEEVRRLRAELAVATQAILTVSSQPVSARDAERWVRKNLNR